MLVKLTPSLLATAALALIAAPAAMADTNQSSNWAGYAIHRPGVKFTKVIGSWKQPKATCAPGANSYSASWVGLGGYSDISNALEQVGTEADCSASGTPQYSAWYELVPAASQPIFIHVRPGDQINATVTVNGHRVVVTLSDLTSHRAFHKTLSSSQIDVSSAEWIEEAPSECFSDDSCNTLPLADFGSVTFGTAKAQLSNGHLGSISNGNWGVTKISLVPDGGERFISYAGGSQAYGAATPSPLKQGGSSFKVNFSEMQSAGQPFAARDASVHEGPWRLVHPLR
jgi:Peptidase A4 family